ncbi:MAG: hypothetical protein DCF15_19125 [Phormidesmis priestleyi]|uniref:Uncharacterized protein n=1 Tax=Phormidesmis priestleyi TaxID=268141 RepID=A0A2W4YJS2_9CYAN|nr:MAG: hypothetical protein DCF15_19125 [Phormidesmis priestleyi]
MSDPVLSQLVAVESDLAQQSETLTMQLSQIQEQRQGLRTVISMFQGANGEEIESLSAASTSALPDEADLSEEEEVEVEAEAEPAAVEKEEIEKAEVEEAEVEEAEPEVEKAAAKKSASKKGQTKKVDTKKTKLKPTTAEPATKSVAQKPAAKTEGIKKKKDGRAATWQKYVQADYREAALPEAVSSVLRSQPSDIFAIADVMSSIFREDMPRPSYLKARNRISNILSAGARDGTWYRGRNGRYSQSESVMKAK